jgi:alpha-ribazole phosphatase
MEIYLIRHTAPLIEKGICYGQSDIPLADSFEEEWNKLQEKLPEKIDCIFSSPLRRCLLLAEKIQQFYQVPIIEDKRLMEMNFGEWELEAWNDIEQPALNKWMNNYVCEPCPGGESYSDLIFRVNAFVEDLRKLSVKRILIVTHGGVIKSFYKIIHRLSPEEALKQPVVYGGIYRFAL